MKLDQPRKLAPGGIHEQREPCELAQHRRERSPGSAESRHEQRERGEVDRQRARHLDGEQADAADAEERGADHAACRDQWDADAEQRERAGRVGVLRSEDERQRHGACGRRADAMNGSRSVSADR